MPETQITELAERVERGSAFLKPVLEEVRRVVVGQQEMVEGLLIGMIAGGHVLLEGVPGLAKTLTVSTLAQTFSVGFQRIQFTPDLLPADLVGTLVYNQKEGDFFIKKGPVFSNLILADEVNRAPAKVQSALLEAMQERQVTIGDSTFRLKEPFLVLATQNPVEQEGTYPLPEAQVDRFMLKLVVGYPSREDELEIMRRMAAPGKAHAARSVASGEDLLLARSLVGELYVDTRVEAYIVDLVMATRYPDRFGLGRLNELIAYGASPRASIFLNRGARAQALLQGRAYVTPDDVRSIAPDVLRHRISLTYEAEAEEITTENIVSEVLAAVEVP
jgi:MoxR-like ATPase